MRVVINVESADHILRWTQRGLYLSAAIAFAYCAFVLADSWLFQREENHQLDLLLAAQSAPPDTLDWAAYSASPDPLPSVAANSLIGRVEIARLGLSVIVMEGTSGTTLRRAVGHIRDTALPGQPGNIGISGHRDTFFRPLRNIRRDDLITLTTIRGNYDYRVVSTKIVSPSEVSVLDPTATEVLTLVTCYPFYFVGSAPERFIVRAERIGNTR